MPTNQALTLLPRRAAAVTTEPARHLLDPKLDPKLFDIYRDAFEVVPADSAVLLEEVHRLRYQIYCVENSYEDPTDNPGGLEKDSFDSHSAHCLLRHRPSGVYIGTVRMILPQEDLAASFSVQHACDDPMVKDPSRYPSQSTGEISRICLSRERRRQCGRDPALKHAFLGLAQASVLLSERHGITHWLGLMERSFIKRVGLLGIFFEHVGEAVDYHGPRQPISANLAKLLTTVHQLRPDVWEVMTDRGRLGATFKPWELVELEWSEGRLAW